MNKNEDVINGFGDEWTRFDQSCLDDNDLQNVFNDYFSVFPWDLVSSESSGFEMGCGSGRWAQLVAPRVRELHCIDASSEALNVAKKLLSNHANCKFHLASVDEIPLKDSSQDFAYSLGVLHHVPNMKEAMRSCVSKLKSGAPFLIYCYYRFDNKPVWFRLLWKMSDIMRKAISRLPYWARYYVSQVIAFIIYFPLARVSYVLEKLGIDVLNFPLSYYRDKTLYVMRTDSLDRFGTRLEHRVTKGEMRGMMLDAGLNNIKFSEKAPFWCAVGIKK